MEALENQNLAEPLLRAKGLLTERQRNVGDLDRIEEESGIDNHHESNVGSENENHSESDSNDDDSEEITDTESFRIFTISFISLAGVGFSIFGMFTFSVLPVFIMGGVCCAVSPTLPVIEKVIAKKPSKFENDKTHMHITTYVLN